MSALEIVSDLRRASEILAERDDPAAKRAAEVLWKFLETGVDFETAAGLGAGWRDHVHARARDRTLREIVARHPGMRPYPMAVQIAAGLRAVARHVDRGPPAGLEDLYRDLARNRCPPSVRQLRKLLTALIGPREQCEGQSRLSCSRHKENR